MWGDGWVKSQCYKRAQDFKNEGACQALEALIKTKQREHLQVWHDVKYVGMDFPYSPKHDMALRLLHNCLLAKDSDKRFWKEVEDFLEVELDKHRPPEPGCKHEYWIGRPYRDNNCRDCGEKLR